MKQVFQLTGGKDRTLLTHSVLADHSDKENFVGIVARDKSDEICLSINTHKLLLSFVEDIKIWLGCPDLSKETLQEFKVRAEKLFKLAS